MTLTRWLLVPALVVAAALVLSPTTLAQAPAGLDRLITLDAEEAPLPSVLKILGEKGNLNIITGPGVTSGRLTIHMRDVPIDQALNLVVRAAGLSYERIGNSVLVADAKSLKEETGLSSYVLDLKFADAQDVRQALSKISSDIEIDKQGNRIIVVTSPSVISQIQEIVSVLDVPARQVMLEARIVEVSTDAAKKLGIDWEKLSRQPIVFQEGRPAGSQSGREALPDSIPWFRSPSGGLKDLFRVQGEWWREGYGWATALDLMIRDGHARVLASPKVATLNGRPASILIGSRIPFQVSGTTFAGGAAAPVDRIEREEVGIKLMITPLINADGYITTEVKPEVSAVTGFRGDLPIISTRQASTTVRLKDGNTVIIGGLLTEEKSSTVTKVPILGEIPGLGLLFQHHDTITNKIDLVIEVTPRILTDQP